METSLLVTFEEIPCTIVYDLLHITITVCVTIANAITLFLTSFSSFSSVQKDT